MHGDGIVFIWRTESCERHYKFRDTHITSPRVFSNVLLDFGQEQRSPVSVLISKPSSKARLRELITRIRHNFCQHFWVGFLATVTLRVTNRHRFGHSHMLRVFALISFQRVSSSLNFLSLTHATSSRLHVSVVDFSSAHPHHNAYSSC